MLSIENLASLDVFITLMILFVWIVILMIVSKKLFMTNKLDKLGYRVNLKTSVLLPTKRIVFFGLIIDTVVFKVFLTEEKVDKIVSLGKLLLNKEMVLIRCLAFFIGLVVYAFKAVTVGPLHYSSMERDKISALSSSNGDFDTETNLSEIARKYILWWVSNLKKFNGKLIRPNTFRLSVMPQFRVGAQNLVINWLVVDGTKRKHKII